MSDFAAIPIVLVALAVPVELLLYLFAPGRLAWLAWRRMGLEQVQPLNESALEALSADPAGAAPEAGYRQGARRQPRLGNVRLDPVLRGDDYVARLFLDRGFAVVRLRYRFFGLNRSLGLARIDLRIEGNNLIASARYTGTPLGPFLLAAMTMIGGSIDEALRAGLPLAKALPGFAVVVGGMTFLLGLVSCLVMYLARLRLEPSVLAVTEAICEAARGERA
jgi:hypothetical protein